jgi:tetratricopeptide (TPR) repeat protein
LSACFGFNPQERAMRFKMRRCFLICALCAAPGVNAQAFLPRSDAQVLERLPLASDAANRRLRELRNALGGGPKTLASAVELAQAYIDLGRQEADPRYYGYAQGALAPWWAEAHPPPEVLLPRALILQHRHEFDAALRDLDALLRQRPDYAQAWLARAVILQVRARYAEARDSCLPLAEMNDPLPAAICLAQAVSLLGQAEKSYAFLQEAMGDAADAPPAQKQWGLGVLAEMAARLGKVEDASRWFAQALALGRAEAYLLGAYADFLLDQERPAEVVALLQDQTRIDSLLLRLALAKQKLGSPDLAEVAESVRARFAAGRMRGESLHQGDEARFTLYLLGQPQAALRLAQANWAAQREPKDARILLEAAVAARDAEAARPVLELLAKTGMQHLRLQALAEQIKGM